MQFEWDEAKNLDNIYKHQIDFADIPEMFEGPMLIELDDRFDYGEYRWSDIGFLGNGIAVGIFSQLAKESLIPEINSLECCL